MKATAPSDSPSAPPPVALHAHLSAQARRQLETLRSAIDVRLTVLEAVLADPSRGESLEGLILDLARVATDEAQAAAAKACLDARTEAEATVAGRETEALNALEEERATTRQLRDGIESAERHIAALEQQQQVAAASAREQVQAAVTRERANVVELERAVGELRRQLETDRGAMAELRKAAARADEATDALARETSRAQAAELDLASERTKGRDLAKAAQKAQADIEAERSASAGRQETLKGELARLREATAVEKEAHTRLKSERDQLAAEALQSREAAVAQQKALEHTREQLEAERAASAGLQARQQELVAGAAQASEALAKQEKALAQAHGQLEAERTASAKLRAVQERADELLRTVGSDQARSQSAHAELVAELTRERGVAAAAQGALAHARAQLDTERGVAAELRTVVDQTEQRLASVVSENVQAQAFQTDLEQKLAAVLAENRRLQAELGASKQLAGDVAANPAPAVGPASTVATPARPARVIESDESTWRPVRLAHRYQFREPIEMQINGTSGTLFDLSITGCQLVSAGAVKPNQQVKLLISSGADTLVCAGKVMWSRLEPPVSGRPFGYRAGVQFIKPDQAAIEDFVAKRAAAGR